MKKALLPLVALVAFVLAPSAADAGTRYTPPTTCTSVKVTQVVNGEVVSTTTKTSCPFVSGRR